MIEALTGKKIRFFVMDKIKLHKASKGIDNQAAVQNAPAQQRQGWGLEYELHQAHCEKQENVETAFDLKNSQNQLQGDISKTEIFLMENGLAGTVQHVDLAV